MNKKIIFLTGTRADFGKLKSLINKVEQSKYLDAYIFITGMHMISKYGMTSIEVEKCGYKKIYKYINQNKEDSMDIILSKTINGLSDYIKEIKPDMIVIHGDRVEAMAGAIVGSLNNILVAHIEGGEVSGTIDEMIRHSVSKMSHIHYVSNEKAKQRLLQLGERENSIYVIGSPDLDIMNSPSLPKLDDVKSHYNIRFDEYAIFMYHPVTTDIHNLKNKIKEVVKSILAVNDNYIVIYPNNDMGSEIIMNELDSLNDSNRFRIFPSIKFESFLTLLKNAKYIIGNSSAGIREAPFYGLPTINIGSRQNNRSFSSSIVNVNDNEHEIISAINNVNNIDVEPINEFGNGSSDELFYKSLVDEDLWLIDVQKTFVDL